MPENVDRERTWEWMRKSDLKVETEALIFAAQEQALRTNAVKFNIDKTKNNPLCRLCGEKSESVTHLVCGCKGLCIGSFVRGMIVGELTNGMSIIQKKQLKVKLRRFYGI